MWSRCSALFSKDMRHWAHLNGVGSATDDEAAVESAPVLILMAVCEKVFFLGTLCLVRVEIVSKLHKGQKKFQGYVNNKLLF